MAAPLAKVLFRFVDREGNKASTQVYITFSLTPSEVSDFINLFAPKLQAVSNGFLYAVDVYWNVRLAPTGPADVDSDVNARVLLYYSRDGNYEALDIPSPKPALFEGAGLYAGVRVNAMGPAFLAFNADLFIIGGNLQTPEGEAFPSTFVVGGLAL